MNNLQIIAFTGADDQVIKLGKRYVSTVTTFSPVEKPNFAMFTPAGNKAVAAAVSTVLNDKTLKTRKARLEALIPSLYMIAVDFGEVWDTMVREYIWDALAVRRRN